jgi:hypothetical protein
MIGISDLLEEWMSYVGFCSLSNYNKFMIEEDRAAMLYFPSCESSTDLAAAPFLRIQLSLRCRV